MKQFFENFGKAMAGLTLFVLIILATGVILGYPTMWLWNYVCPDTFGLPKISFEKAWAMLVLSGLLFKSTK